MSVHLEIIHITYPIQEHTPKHLQQILAIGDFDGVHLGHQEVIERSLRIAHQCDLPASIMTFHPHPREVLGQSKYRKLLTPLNKKMELFRNIGIDRTYIVHFDSAFMRLSPQQFVQEILIALAVHSVVIGFDFTFGHLGQGNPDSLYALSQEQFSIEVVKPYHIEDQKVSSTFIRDALHLGHIERVTKFLGRPYSLKGSVVQGHQRGRTIGFPTANIHLNESYVIPMKGVYVVHAITRGITYGGVMNIGVKPTFEQEAVETIEVHLFDFNQDIYGEDIEVHILQFLRHERKFDSIEQLVHHIHEDVELSHKFLNSLST